jgi:hypothetical protein
MERGPSRDNEIISTSTLYILKFDWELRAYIDGDDFGLGLIVYANGLPAFPHRIEADVYV